MDIAQRLTEELRDTVLRLRQSDSNTDEPSRLPGALPVADPLDGTPIAHDRDVDFGTRSLLIERAHRLASALGRVRQGTYGICDECAQPIAPGRLAIMPEVPTCHRCQDGRERMERQSESREVALVGEADEDLDWEDLSR